MKAGWIRVFALMVSDLLCIYGCWLAALWGYCAVGFGHYKFGLEFYFKLWPVGLAFILFNAVFRLYHGNPFCPGAAVPPAEELRRLCGSALLTHLGLIAFLAFARQTTVDYSRFAMAAAGVLTAVLAQPVRNLTRMFLRRLRWGDIPVVVIGADADRKPLVRALAGDAYTGFRCVAEGEDVDSPAVDAARRTGARIAIACQGGNTLGGRLERLLDRFMFVEFVPSAETFPVAGAHVSVFDGHGAVELVNQRQMSALRAEKRVLDAVLATIAFVLLAPLFVLIPILLKLTSRGPVFYRQERLGKRGRRIRVWKFRSMYADADARLERILASDPVRRAEWERDFKLTDDPRVTPLGRFLRRTSLDEIPQLFNVFCGDMTLIGPRPIVEQEVPYYGSAYSVFSSVRPGVTGLWQATGRSDVGYARRVALDVYYVMNWSPWLDLWILFRTVSAVFLMRGAR